MSFGRRPGATHDAVLSGPRVPGATVRTLAAVTVWPVGLGIACTQCVVARTGGEWLTGALVIGWFVVLDRMLGIPARAWLPAFVRYLLPVSGVVALGALFRVRDLSTGWAAGATALEAGVLVALVVLGVLSRAAYRGIADTPLLHFPLHEGTWRAAEGEGRLLNHHWPVPVQRAALDLIRVGANGMSHRRLRAGRAGEYFGYGTPVFSPCDGVVVGCLDGVEDTRTAGSHPAGNHVVIDAGGIRIVLAHLAKGTVQVVPGQPVAAGTELGLVGNSGNSTEPHLHIHAQRVGAPVRLRFAGRGRRFPRGASVQAPI